MLSLKNIFGDRRRRILYEAESVYDLFTCNLKYLPDTSFEKARYGRVVHGRNHTVYVKEFKKRECGLFETVEVITHKGFEKKVISFIGTNIDTEVLADFVNACNGLYSSAKSHGREFDDNDYDQVEGLEWEGRSWALADLPKLKLDMTEGVLQLDITLT